MFKSLFEEVSTLNLERFIYITIVSIICGLISSIVYIITHKNKNDNSGFATTLFMLPVVVAIIIILVASDFARAFSIAGVFALIKFRSEQSETKDITYILLASGLGLACGLGYIWLALMIVVICSILLLILEKVDYGKSRSVKKHLKIVIPENLNYENIFDQIMDNYCSYSFFQKVKTTDYGSLFELSYIVTFKNNASEKQFIDELRVLNGNLDISLVLIP